MIIAIVVVVTIIIMVITADMINDYSNINDDNHNENTREFRNVKYAAEYT